MATISEVKSTLNTIASEIAEVTRHREQAKASLSRGQLILAQLPARHTAVLAAIDGYAPTGAFQTLAKDEKGKLAAEFTALKAAIEAELTLLNITFE